MEMMANTNDLIMSLIEEGFIIVAICFVIGQLIKTSKIKIFKQIPNENIPIITTIIGVLLGLIPEIFPNDPIIISLMKGAISGWAASGMFEFYRNYKKKILKTECEIEREVQEELEQEYNEKEA